MICATDVSFAYDDTLVDKLEVIAQSGRRADRPYGHRGKAPT